MGNQKIIRGLIVVLIGTSLYSCHMMNKKSSVSESVRKVAREKLQYAVENSTEWEKVHAAEYILKLDDSNNVHDIFIEEEKQKRDEPYYRIGLWRVLNQSAITSEDKNGWLDSISKVYENYTSLDRNHAAETLAKLKVSPNTISIKVTDSILESDHNALWVLTYWGTAYTTEKDMHLVKEKFLSIILKSKESTLVKRIALYALYTMKDMSVQNWDLLISKTLKEPENSELYISLLTCTLANTPKDSLGSPRVVKCRENLKRLIDSLSGTDLSTALAVYKDIATEEDISYLTSFMNIGDDENNTEIIMAAANALLRIDREGR